MSKERDDYEKALREKLEKLGYLLVERETQAEEAQMELNDCWRGYAEVFADYKTCEKELDDLLGIKRES